MRAYHIQTERYGNIDVQEYEENRRWLIELGQKTSNNERIAVELTRREVPRGWKDAGRVRREAKEYWKVKTYEYDDNGDCHSDRHNPILKIYPREYISPILGIDFNWILDATEDNANLIIGEIWRLANEEVTR